MVHPSTKDRPSSTTSTSTIDMFTYCPFDMSFNINSQDVPLDFHIPLMMCQWNEVLIQINKQQVCSNKWLNTANICLLYCLKCQGYNWSTNRWQTKNYRFKILQNKRKHKSKNCHMRYKTRINQLLVCIKTCYYSNRSRPTMKNMCKKLNGSRKINLTCNRCMRT